jgi:hypothetical protein
VTRASEEEAGEKLRRAGVDTVFTPYALAGRQLADVLPRPHGGGVTGLRQEQHGRGVEGLIGHIKAQNRQS